MAKDKDTAAAAKKKANTEVTAFTMTTPEGKNFKVVSPNDSLDEDGDAEEVLEGIYRKG